MKLLIADVETGGLDARNCSILQVGLVSWHSGRITGTDEFYVREPKFLVTEGAMEVNGIDLDIVDRHGLEPIDACARFNAFVDDHMGTPTVHSTDTGRWAEKARLGGWNLYLDRSFLERMFYLGTEVPKIPRVAHRMFDVPSLAFALAYAGKIDIPVDHINSDSVFSYFGVAPTEDKRHSAKADAIATAELITELVTMLTSTKVRLPG